VLVFPPLATVLHNVEFYDAATKLDADAEVTVAIEPAELPTTVLGTLIFHARTLWDGLGCRGAARVDFIVTPAGRAYALEVNTTPGMSRSSNFAVGARLCGLGLVDAIRAMLHEVLTRSAYAVPLPTPVLHTPPSASETAA
jgi:D-alanine-D-alanine ligase